MFNRNFTVYKYFDFQDALRSQKGDKKAQSRRYRLKKEKRVRISLRRPKRSVRCLIHPVLLPLFRTPGYVCHILTLCRELIKDTSPLRAHHNRTVHEEWKRTAEKLQ